MASQRANAETALIIISSRAPALAPTLQRGRQSGLSASPDLGHDLVEGVMEFAREWHATLTPTTAAANAQVIARIASQSGLQDCLRRPRLLTCLRIEVFVRGMPKPFRARRASQSTKTAPGPACPAECRRTLAHDSSASEATSRRADVGSAPEVKRQSRHTKQRFLPRAANLRL
jgi:hypothetical protein